MRKFIVGMLVFLWEALCASSMEREFLFSCPAIGPQRSPANLVSVDPSKWFTAPATLRLKYSDRFSVLHKIEGDIFSTKLVQYAAHKLASEIRSYSIFHDFALMDFDVNQLNVVIFAFVELQRNNGVDEGYLKHIPASFAYEFKNCENFTKVLAEWIMNKELNLAFDFTYRPIIPLHVDRILESINPVTMPHLKRICINIPQNFEFYAAKIISGNSLDNLDIIKFYYYPFDFSPIVFMNILGKAPYLHLSKIFIECNDNEVCQGILDSVAARKALIEIGVIVIWDGKEFKVGNFESYEPDFPRLYLKLRH